MAGQLRCFTVFCLVSTPPDKPTRGKQPVGGLKFEFYFNFELNFLQRSQNLSFVRCVQFFPFLRSSLLMQCFLILISSNFCEFYLG